MRQIFLKLEQLGITDAFGILGFLVQIHSSSDDERFEAVCKNAYFPTLASRIEILMKALKYTMKHKFYFEVISIRMATDNVSILYCVNVVVFVPGERE